MRKVVALNHPNSRLSKPVFKLPAGWIQLDQITNEFIDELLQVSALKDALKSAPKRWCFIYGSFLKKRSLNELENMHDLDVLAISKSNNTKNVFNGDNTQHLPVKMRDTSLNLSLDYNAFVSKAPYDVDSMGRNWAESLAFKVNYNKDGDTVDACLVTFSNAFKGWLEATHDKPIAYHQIPEILNTNGTYFDVRDRLERAMENKDLIDARQFFLLNKSQLTINQFKRNEGEFIQNESEYSQNGLGLIETEIADFLGYFFNRSMVFSHFKFSKNKKKREEEFSRIKKQVEEKTREILSIIEQNSEVPQYQKETFKQLKQVLMAFVRELGPIINKNDVLTIARYFRQAKVDFSQHSLSIENVLINDYQMLEAQLVNCKISDVIQFFDQVNSNLFNKKQKIESSAIGLLKTLLSKVIDEKQSNTPSVKIAMLNMRQDSKQHKDPQLNYAYSVQQPRPQHKQEIRRRRRYHAKRAEKLKKQSNTEHQAMISKSIDELQLQVRQYQVAFGLILATLLLGSGTFFMSAMRFMSAMSAMSAFKKNKLNSDLVTTGSVMVILFFANLYARWQTVVRAIHVIKDGPTSINKLRALQQAPPNDKTRTIADAIIKDYFTEEDIKYFLTQSASDS